MKEASLYEALENKKVRCTACSHYCNIREGFSGICGTRKNIEGKLFLLTYGRPVAVNVDPIEKKPLFHFLPGTKAFSLGTVGCNFSCGFCQNWDISQATKGRNAKMDALEEWPPERIVEFCMENGIPSIAYTYNEPSIFLEYALDTAKLAHRKGIRNVFVSNGYGSEESLLKMKNLLDGINIDLKSFSHEYYRKVCGADIEPVLANIKRVHSMGVWVEVTTLLVPGQNDSPREMESIAGFIAEIDSSIPWHISRFFPHYKMSGLHPTPIKILETAYKIGKDAGLNHVYLGNVGGSGKESTYCPSCGKIAIERSSFEVLNNTMSGGKCGNCSSPIRGVWK